MSGESSKRGLPEGWIVKTSTKRPNKIYYFNLITGEATWECPVLDEPQSAKENTDNLLKERNVNYKRPLSYAFANDDSGSDNDEKKFCSPLSKKFLNRVPVEDHVQNFNPVSPPTTTPCSKSISSSSKVKNETKFSVQSNVTEIPTYKRNKALRLSSDSLSPTKDSNVLDISSSSDTVEDIEMLDLTGDLKRIEDIPTGDPSSYMIVIDTNIFIHELKYIDEIVSTPIGDCGLPQIFIPWVVIQELDNLRRKCSKKLNLLQEAQAGVKLVSSMLKSKHPRFHGQSIKEVKDWAQPFSECNDDRILECCMSIADRMAPEKVILLTNDINLANKALICDILVYDMKSFLKEFHKTSKPSDESNKSKQTSQKVETVVPNTKVPDQNDIKFTNKIMQCDKNTKKIVSNTQVPNEEIFLTSMTEARELLKEILIQFVKKEMYEAYGDPWIKFKLDLDTLRGLLESVVKYWRTVYCFRYDKRDSSNFVLLRDKACSSQGFFCKDDCLKILLAIEEVFTSIHKNWPEMKVPVKTIHNLRSNCEKQASDLKENKSYQSEIECVNNIKSVPVETKPKSKTTKTSIPSTNETAINKNKLHSSIPKKTESKGDTDNIQCSPSDYEAVLPVFEHIWVVVNHLCGMYMDFYGIPHNFPYDKPETIPSELEFDRLMCNLYPNVKQLKINMVKIFETKTGPKFFGKFRKMLKAFVPSLQVQVEPVDTTNFTVSALLNFCMDPSNKERLLLGYEQLKNFNNKLEEALAAMSSFKKNVNSNTMECD